MCYEHMTIAARQSTENIVTWILELRRVLRGDELVQQFAANSSKYFRVRNSDHKAQRLLHADEHTKAKPGSLWCGRIWIHEGSRYRAQLLRSASGRQFCSLLALFAFGYIFAMPFELRKSFAFEASHVLTGHNGKCARLHGHSYILTLVLRGARLQRRGPQSNMLADFCDISAAAKKVIASHLDHHHLNDTLQTESPTAEFIARWIYRALAPALGPRLVEVELRETATAVVLYRPSRTTARRFADAWTATRNGATQDAFGLEYESDATSDDSGGFHLEEEVDVDQDVDSAEIRATKSRLDRGGVIRPEEAPSCHLGLNSATTNGFIGSKGSNGV